MIKSVKRLGVAVLSAVMMLTAVATPLCDSLPIVSESVADVASAETYGDFEYSVLDDGTVEITKYIGSAEKVEIPEKINGKSVTSIGNYAFEYCENITSVTIPDSVTSIGFRVFSNCTSLTSITIPNSVTSISGEAFENCTSLTAINVASENSNYVSVNGVLYNKDKTTIICYPAGKKDNNYKIPDSVTEIDDYAFNGCISLSSVTIPNSVTSIGVYAFEYCASLKSITIPDSVPLVGPGAFSNCTNLTSVTIQNGVMYIGNEAFANCTSLTGITIPDSVTWIGRYSFGGCTSLTSITIPNSVTSIGKKAFGYYYDYDMNCSVKYNDFKIKCYSNTVGEQYAKDNGLAYELLDKPTIANVTGFKVKSIFSTNVTLQWNKNTSASGYEIEQYKSGKWVNVAKITSNTTTSYTVKGLAAGTAGYKFRMRAVRDCAYSDYTSALSVNTNPYGVGGFKCSSKTSTSVTLKWNKGTTASGYQLQQYKDGKRLPVTAV